MNLAKAVEAASREKSDFAFLYDLKVSLITFDVLHSFFKLEDESF